MSDTGKQSPLGVNVMSGLVQGKGFWVNQPTANIVGSSTSSTNYTSGTIINNSCLYWVTNSINLSYNKVTAETYANITSIGSSTIPALGNSPPPTYTYTGSPFWTGPYQIDGTGYGGETASWGYIRLHPWQGYNEFNYNDTLSFNGMYTDFCGSFISASSFIDYSNKSIMAAQNSIGFLEGTYSNMNDLTTADVTNVSLATGVFGRDLINLGKALDLSTIWTFGFPSNLLVTLKKYNALTPSLSVALLAAGLTTNEIDNISSNINVTTEQQQKTYAAFLLIGGVDLAAILVSLNCNTVGLTSLADLLDVKKMFPQSYLSLTVPIYNAVPGPTNSKTYYPIFSTSTADGGLNSALSAPAIVASVGTTIPPLPPANPPSPPPATMPTAPDKTERYLNSNMSTYAVGRDGGVGVAIPETVTRTFRG